MGEREADAWLDGFKSTVKEQPVAIRRLGLGIALALGRGAPEGSPERVLHDCIAGWLQSTGKPYEDEQDVLHALTRSDQRRYATAVCEAMALLSWLKHFVVAIPEHDRARAERGVTGPASSSRHGDGCSRAALPDSKTILRPHDFPGGGHAGLWFDKYFNRFDEMWNPGARGDAKERAAWRLSWIETIEGRQGETEKLASFAARQKALVAARGGTVRSFKTDWHFVIGTGNPNVIENGLAWHHTLGVPYVCGDAVKGLVQAWVRCWMDAESQGEDVSALARRWFGDASDGIGALMFFDATPVAPVELIADVMTPHMGEWYEHGDHAVSDGSLVRERVPADWHSPTPVHFLCVRDATYQFAIAPTRRAVTGDVEGAFAALEEALRVLGVGAKTGAGYGRMSPA
jgi:CRISPR-associated protein Cmr6